MEITNNKGITVGAHLVVALKNNNDKSGDGVFIN
jgi:hypothetical protein